MIELSKADRKAAREIIEKGLQQEFANGLDRSFQILSDWKAGNKSNRDAYHALYGHIQDYDKHIARRYDNMKGSTYLFIIAGQINDGITEETELQKLSPEAIEFVQRILYLSKRCLNQSYFAITVFFKDIWRVVDL
jgi:hypothetical protein